MDGVHDLAGRQGFGRVQHTANADLGPIFKYDWEPIGYGGFFAGYEKGHYSIDEVRHAVERIEPQWHMITPYYERYVVATASLLVEKGVITQQELEDAAGGPWPLARPAISEGRPAREPQGIKPGDRVRVRNDYFAGHVRYPAYCRGKVGTVVHRTTELWPFPDSIGHGRSDHGSEPTLHVEFDAKELWGETAGNDMVVVDLFEGYLEPA